MFVGNIIRTSISVTVTLIFFSALAYFYYMFFYILYSGIKLQLDGDHMNPVRRSADSEEFHDTEVKGILPKEKVETARMYATESELNYSSFGTGGGNLGYAWSAYYDDRILLPAVRVIMALPMEFQDWRMLKCDVQTEDGEWYDDLYADMEMSPKSANSHRAGIATCQLPEIPQLKLTNVDIFLSSEDTSLVTANLPIRYPNKGRMNHNFTLCSEPMYQMFDPNNKSANQQEVTKILEFLHVLMIFGVSNFQIYDVSLPDFLKQVLVHYPELEIIKFIRPNNTNFDLEQTVAVLDCAYKHMWDSRYIIHLGRDELIVPMQDNDYMEMLSSIRQSHPQCYSFAELNFRCMVVPPIHCLTPEETAKKSEAYAELKKKEPEVDFYWLRCLKGKRGAFEHKISSKYILNPRHVDFVGVHYVHTVMDLQEGDCERINVDTSLGNLYRRISHGVEQVKDEKRMMDFDENLVNLTKKRLQHLHKNLPNLFEWEKKEDETHITK